MPLLMSSGRPTLATDAGIFVQQCHVGLSSKASRVSKHVLGAQFNATVEPSAEVVADAVGPLLETPEGYTYLSIIINRALRWVEAYPMKDNSAEHMLAAFLLFIWRRGCPRILYTDRAGNMLCLLAFKVYERLGIHKSSGSTFRFRVCASAPSRLPASSITLARLRDCPPCFGQCSRRSRLPPLQSLLP